MAYQVDLEVIKEFVKSKSYPNECKGLFVSMLVFIWA